MRSANRFVKIFACVVLLLAVLAAPAVAQPIPVKVLVLTMFEVGENAGDFPGEFQHWYEEYFMKNTASFDVRGVSTPLFVNGDGVAGVVTGMGKARAAATLMAILQDPRFDFSKAYFVTSGCAGASPDRATLGDVFICDTAVDYDLGHSWKESDAAQGGTLFLLDEGYRDNGFIPLNKELVRWAVSLTQNLALADDPKAVEYRRLYPQETANGKPSVRTGTSVTSDNYWHGKGSSEQAVKLCEAYGASPYGVTQMEDNAFAVVLRAMGYLDRYLVVRDVVNFDQPHPGQTVLESLKASSGGFSIGMTNGHRVGTLFVHKILADWPTWEKGIPPLPGK